MEEHSNPFIEQMMGEIRKLLNQFSDFEHQLIEKDIRIATLELELGLQKRFYSILRQSYLNILKSKN